jgi:glycosyltransferase involved in cell wall biosynthesis
MNERAPMVSIGLPVYNGEEYIENALEKIIKQDYEDFELIISDNASNDRTQEICLRIAQNDKRIRYFRNTENIGLAANHNRTFELSRGKFFKWVAHDDDFPGNMLSGFMQVFEKAPPNVSLVYSFCEYIDEEGNVQGIDSDGVGNNNPLPHKRLKHFLRYVHMYNSAYGLIRSEALRRTRMHGLFPGSDHVLLAELAMIGRFVEIPCSLLRIRRHPGRSFTANKDFSSLRELFNPGHAKRTSVLGLWGNIHLEVVRSAVLAPLKAHDKVLCTAVALVIPQYWMLRGFGGKQKQKILKIFKRVASK